MIRYNCPEHGLVRAKVCRDSSVKSKKRRYCPYCNRLNFKAWEVLHRHENRARVRAWYAANREYKIADVARRRAARRLQEVVA